MILTLDVPNSGCSLLLNHKYDSIKIIVHLVKAVSNKGIAWTAKSKMLLQKLKGEPKKKKKKNTSKKDNYRSWKKNLKFNWTSIILNVHLNIELISLK